MLFEIVFQLSARRVSQVSSCDLMLFEIVFQLVPFLKAPIGVVI